MTTQTVREDLVKTISNLPLEALVEVAKYVEFWQFKQSHTVLTPKKKTRKRKHAMEGMWADRTDIVDGATYSIELRRRIENREDGKLSH